LAIIIPAYKGIFLKKTLQSIVEQEDQRFNLYVFDDASPEDLATIITEYGDKINTSYKRFDDNLGKTDLAAHWNRCIANTNDEEYIWLFSDDDVMESTCVKVFYQNLERLNSEHPVFRFNTIRIDEDGQVIMVHPPHPEKEYGLNYLYQIFQLNRRSYVTENIFSREIHNNSGGFVSFPEGWCSDWATIAKYTLKEPGICLSDAYVYWRISTHNITGSKSSMGKIEASYNFYNFVLDLLGQDHKSGIPEVLFKKSLDRWYTGVITKHFANSSPLKLRFFKKYLPKEFKVTKGLVILKLTENFIKRLIRYKTV
jgi:glycosyltransferase involved in cell wall biosynthesis